LRPIFHILATNYHFWMVFFMPIYHIKVLSLKKLIFAQVMGWRWQNLTLAPISGHNVLAHKAGQKMS
jgi:hypothetical protein